MVVEKNSSNKALLTHCRLLLGVKAHRGHCFIQLGIVSKNNEILD